MKSPPLSVQLLTAGSAACVADIFTFPLDTAKVRLQVSTAMAQALLQARLVKRLMIIWPPLNTSDYIQEEKIDDNTRRFNLRRLLSLGL